MRAVYGGTEPPAGAPHAQPCTCMMTSWSTSRRASALRPEEMSGRPPGRPPSRQCPPWTLGPWWPRAWTPRPPQRPPRIDTDVAAPIVLTVTLTGTGRRRERAASPDTAGRDGRRGALPRRGARWSRRLRRGCTQRHPRPPGRLQHGADGRQTWTTRFGGGRPRDSRVCGRSRCHCRGHFPPSRPPGGWEPYHPVPPSPCPLHLYLSTAQRVVAFGESPGRRFAQWRRPMLALPVETLGRRLTSVADAQCKPVVAPHARRTRASGAYGRESQTPPRAVTLAGDAPVPR